MTMIRTRCSGASRHHRRSAPPTCHPRLISPHSTFLAATRRLRRRPNPRLTDHQPAPTHPPRFQGVLELHAERLDDHSEEREELWKAIEGLRLAEPPDVTGFTEIDRTHLTFGSGMPLVRRDRT